MGDILIDSRVAGNDGIGRFTRNIIHRVHSYYPKLLNYIVREEFSIVSDENVYYDSSKHYTCEEMMAINKAIKKFSPKVVHCTDYRVPFTKPTIPLIVSIHDIFRYTDIEQCYTDDVFIKNYGKDIFNEMIMLTDMIKTNILNYGEIRKKGLQKSSKAHFNYYATVLEWALIISDVVVTPSNFVKEEILKHFNIKSKIETIYYGVDHIGENKATVYNTCIDKIDIEKPYFLYVGQWRKHKNVDLLLDAFNIVSEFRSDVYLYLAGKDFVHIENPSGKLINDRVKFLGYVKDYDLKKVYSSAISLVHLATHEGFGFTPIEALLNNCKVIASKNPTTMELLKDNVEFVDIDNIDSIVEAMKNSINKGSYKKNNVNLAYNFSWDNTVNKFISLYSSLRDC